MKNIKRFLAGAAAMAMVFGLAACGDTSSDSGSGGGGGGNAGGGGGGAAEEAAEVTTTTGVTVAVNTEDLKEGEEEIIAKVAEKLPDKQLENDTIKWLAHYDINPSTNGASKSVALNLFETKYNGKIQWYPTDWNNRYNDLSTYVLGGEGIDFFPADTAALPKGVVSGMFQPVDDYIDLNGDLWGNFKDAMEIYNFNGKHYEFIVNVSAEQVVLYNKQTIEENGLEDPYEQWKNGEWNWDTFKASLVAYVDPDADCYGLDGYWAEKALFLSAGVPAISTTPDGSLISNMTDATVEKAMNFGYDLFNNNLIINREIFDWAEQPQFMGEGKELFYIIGAWGVSGAPETWSTKIAPENLGVVPVPSPAGSENYMAATLDGWCLCKGAGNPEGVAAYGECTILGNIDEDAVAIGDRKMMDDAGWSEELVQINKDINAQAKAHPVVDLATGVSSDVASLTTDGGDNVGTRAAFHGVEWATTRDASADVIAMLVDEVDQQIKAMG